MPEVLRQIRTYLPEDLRQIRTYLPEDLRQISSYVLCSSEWSCTALFSIIWFCKVLLRIILPYYCIVLFGMKSHGSWGSCMFLCSPVWSINCLLFGCQWQLVVFYGPVCSCIVQVSPIRFLYLESWLVNFSFRGSSLVLKWLILFSLVQASSPRFDLLTITTHTKLTRMIIFYMYAYLWLRNWYPPSHPKHHT